MKSNRKYGSSDDSERLITVSLELAKTIRSLVADAMKIDKLNKRQRRKVIEIITAELAKEG